MHLIYFFCVTSLCALSIFVPAQPGWYKIPVNIPSLDFQSELTVKLAMR